MEKPTSLAQVADTPKMKRLASLRAIIYMVARGRIELPTRGFSVQITV